MPEHEHPHFQRRPGKTRTQFYIDDDPYHDFLRASHELNITFSDLVRISLTLAVPTLRENPSIVEAIVKQNQTGHKRTR